MRLRVTGPPQRLDRFLVAHWPPPIGRRRLAVLLARGEVRVNGRPARKATLVRAGDEIAVLLPAEPEPPSVADPRVRLVHRGARFVAVDKPPGLPTTAGPTPGPSVAAALLARFPEMAVIEGPRAAGLAHRLDTGTSGLLVAARSAEAHAALRAAFREKAVIKDYLAIVLGRLRAPRTVSHPLRRHPRSQRRMILARAEAPGSWPAVTSVAPLRTAPALTLVHLRMRTGVTHQLRVHLAALGHPVLGDARYGGADAAGAEPEWHYLHAAVLRADVAGLPPRLAAPFPRHWRALCERLGWEPLARGLPELD